ncbi:hypothetical protein ACFQ0D_00210 [Micromonospora zhanjiangensis]
MIFFYAEVTADLLSSLPVDSLESLVDSALTMISSCAAELGHAAAWTLYWVKWVA